MAAAASPLNHGNSITLDLWAYTHGVQLDFSRPGKPVDNAVCEAFNGNVRRECLMLHWFASLAEAQHVVTQWRDEYNNFRPHRGLGYWTPSGTPRDGDHHPRPLHAVS